MDMFLKCNMCGNANRWTLPKNGQVSHLICQTCGSDIGKAECGCVTVKKPSDGNALFSDIRQGLISTIDRYAEAKMERRNAIDVGNKIHERILCNCKPNDHSASEILFDQLWNLGCMLTDTQETKTPYQEVAAKIGDLVSKKQLQYGDSFGKSSKILEVLYPDGIPVDQYTDALAIVRVIDKLFRISTGNQGDEDAWSDVCGYSILSIAKNMRDAHA